jgi:hypothetical protein
VRDQSALPGTIEDISGDSARDYHLDITIRRLRSTCLCHLPEQTVVTRHLQIERLILADSLVNVLGLQSSAIFGRSRGRQVAAN